VQSNTRLATHHYAAQRELRELIFAAYWRQGADIGDHAVLANLGARDTDATCAATWHDEWVATNSQVVPTMIDGEGAVVAGLDALAYLAQLAAPRRRADDAGGEAPCFAHLLADESDVGN
jgi:hypothetical protein